MPDFPNKSKYFRRGLYDFNAIATPNAILCLFVMAKHMISKILMCPIFVLLFFHCTTVPLKYLSALKSS